MNQTTSNNRYVYVSVEALNLKVHVIKFFNVASLKSKSIDGMFHQYALTVFIGHSDKHDTCSMHENTQYCRIHRQVRPCASALQKHYAIFRRKLCSHCLVGSKYGNTRMYFKVCKINILRALIEIWILISVDLSWLEMSQSANLLC